MNRLMLAVMLSPLAVAWPSSTLGQSGSPVEMTIQTKGLTFKKGAEIKLEMTLTNISDRPIDVYTASGANGGAAEYDNGIYVRDASGNLLPRIDGRTVVRSDGKTIKVRSGLPSRRGVTLQPGGQFQDFTVLNRLFDLSSPGIYTVSAAHEVRLDHASPVPALATATSNSVQITVIDTANSQ